MISGAAKFSDPQRVWRSGEVGEMKRERPKSVSFRRGEGRRCRGIEPVDVGGRRKGLAGRRISGRNQLLYFDARGVKVFPVPRDPLSSLISRCTTPTSCNHPTAFTNIPNTLLTNPSPTASPLPSASRGPGRTIRLRLSSSLISSNSSPPSRRSSTRQ